MLHQTQNTSIMTPNVHPQTESSGPSTTRFLHPCNSVVPLKPHHTMYTSKACWLCLWGCLNAHVFPWVVVIESFKCEVQTKT